MVFGSLISAFAVAVLALGVEAYSAPRAPASTNNLHRRLTGQTVAFACFGGGGDCECPTDKNGDSGVLINVYPGYQCAYPNGACTWDDKSGALTNIFQTNCPTVSPCNINGGCSCPLDNFGDTGVLINQFTGYQCAYTGGACTWDFGGVLQNTAQTNCPTEAKCVQSGSDN
ncbi:hypothetical protein PHLCEN_2v3391 [Hermanssonia centrifuga]|uniref:SSCRP protein n=1 Tax=Hermanssonia centrifuga TaxID=98765 RepID=A0A2R6QIV1_9APHY|nr:hypothetical protein PHLCEN_2v3391 [Hermanssonia centrifuga]